MARDGHRRGDQAPSYGSVGRGRGARSGWRIRLPSYMRWPLGQDDIGPLERAPPSTAACPPRHAQAGPSSQPPWGPRAASSAMNADPRALPKAAIGFARLAWAATKAMSSSSSSSVAVRTAPCRWARIRKASRSLSGSRIGKSRSVAATSLGRRRRSAGRRRRDRAGCGADRTGSPPSC